MKSAVTLFTGENAYTLLLELRRWKAEFIKRYGSDNLIELTASNLTVGSLCDEVAVLPFLSEKRLVIIQGIPSCEAEELELLYNSIHPHVVVLFIAPVLDKRLKTTKYIQQIATVQTFDVLPPKEVRQWLASYAAQLGLQTTPAVLDVLLTLVGTDQALLAAEAEKVSLLEEPLTISHIHEYCTPNAEAVIWGLMESIGSGDVLTSLQLLQSIYRSGESPIGVWGTFVWMISQLQLVLLAHTEGKANFGSLTKEYGVKFGPAKHFVSLVKKSPQTVATLCEQVAHYDVSIKTGGIQYTDQNQQEMLSVLDTCTMKLCTIAS